MARTHHLRMIDRHPDSERFDALTTGTLQVIGGLAVAFVTMGLLGLSTSVAAPWIVVIGLVPGAATIGRWFLRQRRDSTIYLGELPAGWRPLIEAMANEATDIALLAEAAPSGPLRNHLVESANAAIETVRAAELNALHAGPRSVPDPASSHNAIDLARLAESVRQLCATTTPASGGYPLVDLAERTEQLHEALKEAEHHDTIRWTGR